MKTLLNQKISVILCYLPLVSSVRVTTLPVYNSIFCLEFALYCTLYYRARCTVCASVRRVGLAVCNLHLWYAC